MKNKNLVTVGSTVFILVLLVTGGVLWLANARIAPSMQTIEQPIPDDRIPH